MRGPHDLSRRGFLTAAAGVAGAGVFRLPSMALAAPADNPASVPLKQPSRVALVHGDSRAGNVFQALKRIEPEIRRGLVGKKRVIIKPNLVTITNQLAATHSGCIEGLLEFFSSVYKGDIVIAESAASGPTPEGYDNYKYGPVAGKYKARLIDLDREEVVTDHVLDHRYRPQPIRLYKMLMDRDSYIVSAAVMKTHDRAVVTLSLKNLIVGAFGKDPAFRWGKGGKGRTDKHLVHGGPKNEAIHCNMFALAGKLKPDLALIDGFEGMEGNGPLFGTPVDHKIALAGTDWLAADRVGVELMGFDFAKTGYLTFCAQAGMGEADLGRIEILGEEISTLSRKYRPNDNIEQQYKWMEG